MNNQTDAIPLGPSLVAQSLPQRAAPIAPRTTNDVSTFRLYLLRASYLLIVVGLGLVLWPDLIHDALSLHPRPGATPSLLAGVSLMALLGIRYPLRMLPVLLFELTWKSIWLLTVALPLWSVHQIDADTWESVKACLMGIVIFPIAIPWRYVVATYLKTPAEPWH
jgi:hypothetical protein